MSRFNLVDEPWISVLTDQGRQKDVSLLELFSQAQTYTRLAGDMETQDFAVLRILLAVLQTVFSRYDENGDPNPYVPLDDSMRQTRPVDEDDLEDYEEFQEDLWDNLWAMGHFPDIVGRYLTCWKDRFYLLDQEYPFMQATKEQVEHFLPAKKKATVIAGRNMNRTISESNNKLALFSPVTDKEGAPGKDRLTYAQMARWLITFQGYTGLADKATLASKDQKSSKGWIFDLGGLYLEGKTLFETLMMNLMLSGDNAGTEGKSQDPCWENPGVDIINRLRAGQPVDDLADLYTNWSRAVYMDPNWEPSSPAEIHAVKLPALDHEDAIEPMTMWRYNETGPSKGHYTPRKHAPDQAMWRSFGLISLKAEPGLNNRRPGILSQYDRICRALGSRDITIRAVSMRDDGNATSWVPVDEIVDGLSVNDMVISDYSDRGWVVRINDAVDLTKAVVGKVYKNYLKDVGEIRGMDSDGRETYASRGAEALYQAVDAPFRNWLSVLQPGDSKEDRIKEWKEDLRKLALASAQEVFDQAGYRDYKGIETGDRTKNIATAYLTFVGRLKKQLS